MTLKIVALWLLHSFILSCSASSPEPPSGGTKEKDGTPQASASLGLVGDPSDVEADTHSGLVLMGGSTDVDAALKWMIDRSGGGDVVILRASGTDAYNEYIFDLGAVNSVETLKIDSRSLANDEVTVNKIRNAEMLFIAGGDQAKYVDYWKDTKTMEAINFLMKEKKAPVGGTSAGCAILGNFYFTGKNGSAVSADVISNPYDSRVTLGHEDFLQAPFLENIITDQHFSQREREGRLVVFLARILQDLGVNASGIGVDEKTAVCIDENGIAKVFGTNNAYFLKTQPGKDPEQLVADSVLEWNRGGKAILTYKIPGSTSGAGNFNVLNFEVSGATGGEFYWWSVQGNILQSQKF